jgi:hypothetical protein
MGEGSNKENLPHPSNEKKSETSATLLLSPTVQKWTESKKDEPERFHGVVDHSRRARQRRTRLRSHPMAFERLTDEQLASAADWNKQAKQLGELRTPTASIAVENRSSLPAPRPLSAFAVSPADLASLRPRDLSRFPTFEELPEEAVAAPNLLTQVTHNGARVVTILDTGAGTTLMSGLIFDSLPG